MTNEKDACDRKIAVVVDMAGHKIALPVHNLSPTKIHVRYVFVDFSWQFRNVPQKSKASPHKQDEVVKRFSAARFCLLLRQASLQR